jgi:catechol 2,3-dioxygenase-like lactoylglutathione lyase family enzyme
MIETKGIAHFTIAVTDSVRSTKFYNEVLGLKVLRANHERGMVFLDSGGDCIVLMRTDTTIAPTLQRDAHHAFIVDGDKYDAAVQELKDKGIEIILEEERASGSVVNGRSTYFPDPDGNVLEIVDMYSYMGAQD